MMIFETSFSSWTTKLKDQTSNAWLRNDFVNAHPILDQRLNPSKIFTIKRVFQRIFQDIESYKNKKT